MTLLHSKRSARDYIPSWHIERREDLHTQNILYPEALDSTDRTDHQQLRRLPLTLIQLTDMLEARTDDLSPHQHEATTRAILDEAYCLVEFKLLSKQRDIIHQDESLFTLGELIILSRIYDLTDEGDAVISAALTLSLHQSPALSDELMCAYESALVNGTKIMEEFYVLTSSIDDILDRDALPGSVDTLTETTPSSVAVSDITATAVSLRPAA